MRIPTYLLTILLGLGIFPTAAQPDSQLDPAVLIQRGEALYEASEELFERNIDSCILYTARAAEYFQAAQHWDRYVDMLSGISGAYYYQGNYEEALFHNQRAINGAEVHLGTNSSPYANALMIRGVLQSKKGATGAAIKTLERSLTIAIEQEAAAQRIANTLYNIARFYQDLGDYQRAINHLEQSLEYRQAEPEVNEVTLATTYTVIGQCYALQEKVDQALIHFEKANLILEQQPDLRVSNHRKIEVYHKIAEIKIKQEQYQGALPYLQSAMALQSETERYRKAESYFLLGAVDSGQNKLEAAQAHYERGHQLTLEGLTDFVSHPQIARSHYKLGQLAAKRGAPALAITQYSTALVAMSVPTDAPSPDSNATVFLSELLAVKIFRARAQAHRATFHQHQSVEALRAALADYQAIAQLLPTIRHSYREEGPQQYLAATAAAIYEEALECYWTAYQNARDENLLRAAFFLAEQNKARLLQDAIRANTARSIAGIPDSLLQNESALRSDLNFYRRAIAEEGSQKDGGDPDKIKLWKRQLFEKQQAYQKILAHLEQHYPRYASHKYQHQAGDWPQLREKLRRENAALLEYFVGERQLFAFVLSPTDLHWERIVPVAELREAVHSLRQIVENPPDSRTFQTQISSFHRVAYHLHQQLVAPLLREIPTTVQGLRIVPDEWLHQLPFDLLLRAPSKAEDDYAFGHNAYLFHDYRISYAYSADWWTQYQAPPSSADRVFLGMAPSFSGPIAADRSCAGAQLYNLACSELEVEGIQSLLAGDVLLGPQATRAAFEDRAADYQILHLATHACQSEREGELNKIFFSDDFLSNLELNQLQVRAELAVLSACNTGAGRLARGEGVLSLARGFAVAGCPSVLMTVWAVDDCSTQQLLQHFYRHLQMGKRKDEAIRQAKTAYLLQSDLEHRHPYFWAGFVFFGEGQPLDQGPVHPWYPWIALGLILTALALLGWNNKAALSSR